MSCFVIGQEGVRFVIHSMTYCGFSDEDKFNIAGPDRNEERYIHCRGSDGYLVMVRGTISTIEIVVWILPKVPTLKNAPPRTSVAFTI